MSTVAQYDILDETVTYPAPLTPQQAWRSAIATLASRARKALPDSHGRIDLAVKLILRGEVELMPDGSARVGSQSDPATTYTLHGQGCPCRDGGQAPQGLCKHALAQAIAQKALPLARTLMAQGTTLSMAAEVPEATPADAAPAPDPAPAAPVLALPTIPPQFLVTIQGKPFVTYNGLLHLAHQQGLVSLSARFISVTADLALAEATATFSTGQSFTEAADATARNVNSRIAPHFARMALTRAKARALRDALNVHMVAVVDVLPRLKSGDSRTALNVPNGEC